MAVGLQIVNGDIVFNRAGKVQTVSQTNKCTRDFVKMLKTKSEYVGNETTFDRYNPTYGTQLDNKNLFRGLSKASIRDVAIMTLNEAVKNYITLQESRKNLSLGEIITGINFDAYYDLEQVNTLFINIKYNNALQEAIDLGVFGTNIT